MKPILTALSLILLLFFPYYQKKSATNFQHYQINNGTTFLKAFGQSGIEENSYSFVEVPTGGFLIGGSRGNNSLLVYIDDEGELIWQKEFDFLSDDDEIYDLYIDSEGFLIGNSRINSNGFNQNVIFKFNISSQSLLWTRIFTQPDESRFEGILEKPDGNYILYGRLQPVNACDATLVELDKNDGSTVKIRGFTLDHCEIIIGAIVYDNSIYAVGRYSIDGIGITRFRASLTRFDFEGNEIWSRLYTTPPNLTARTYMTHIVEDNGKLLMVGRGDPNGTQFDDVPLFAYEINPEDGSYNWAKLYDIPGSIYNRPSTPIPTPDGFYLTGIFDQFGDKDYFIMKTDKQGNPDWINGYKLPGDQFRFANIILRDDHLFFAGTIQNPNDSDIDLAFGKVHLDGTFENDECTILEPINVTTTDYSNSYQGIISLSDYDLNNTFSTINITPIDVTMENKIICDSPPIAIETCDNQIDDDGDGLVDCDDPDLQDSCCCLVPPLLNLGPDFELCENDIVILDAGNEFVTYVWQNGNQQASLLIDSPGIFWVETEDQCGNKQTDTIEVLGLNNSIGTDTLEICYNESIDIFGVPQNQAGDYSMTFNGANGCDSVHQTTLNVLEVVNPTQDLMICSGDSIMIFGEFESQTGSYSETLLAVNGCDSVNTINLQVLPPIEVHFETLPACENKNNGFVKAIPTGGLEPYQFIWETSTQNIDSLSNLQPGNYSLTIQDDLGCEKIFSFEIPEQTADLINLNLSNVTCFGNSDGVLNISGSNSNLKFSLDGQIFSNQNSFDNLSPGNYELHIQATNGCEQNIPFFISEPPQLVVKLPQDTVICLGDSLLINSQTNAVQNIDYSWIPIDYLSCSDCPRPFARPIERQIYTLSIFDENGCSASDLIEIGIESKRRVYVPNVFSPNEDGLNDLFYIFSGAEVKRILKFQIFDRWGELIFERENIQPNSPSDGWNGFFNGQKMNPAVFVWMAEIEFLDGEIQILKGDVTLAR